MKSTYYLVIFLTLFLPSLTQAQKQITITIVNPINVARQDELVILKRADLEKKFSSVPGYIQVKSKGKNLIVQYDDLNGDGKWDEAVLLYSFHPLQKETFTLSLTNAPNTSKAIQRAHVRLRKKNPDDSWGPNISKEEMPLRHAATDFSKQPLPLYLTEGPAWENDKVGFRLYFDVRNGKDIWGKRTSRMVLDSVGTKVEPTYHELHDWGMDVLRVGSSLGAGSLALLVPVNNTTDTLIRLGGQNVKRTVYKQLADGPLRAIFQITYDWQIYNKPIQIIEQTSIWGGQYFYQSKVWVSGAPKGAKLVTGIANFYDNVFQAYSASGINVLLSHGRQSENKDNMGIAILIPSKNFSFAASSPNTGSGILNTYLGAQEIGDDQPCLFRFYTGWEKTDARFTYLKLFRNYVNDEAKKMNEQIKIQW